MITKYEGCFDMSNSVLSFYRGGAYADPKVLIDDLTLSDLQRTHPLTPLGTSAFLRQVHALVIGATGGMVDEAFS